MNFHLRTFYYTIDPELRLVHAFHDCAAVKVAMKYNYAERFSVCTEDDAERMDRLMEEKNYRTCGTCYNREQMVARKDNRHPRPGYVHPPAGWKAPTRHAGVRKLKPTTDD